MSRSGLFAFLLLSYMVVQVHAQVNSAPDTPEAGSIQAIASATTDPHYVSPWVAYLPESSSVPSPMKFLGRIPGAPGDLAGTEKAYAYCRALASASPRVKVFTLGRSEEGREILRWLSPTRRAFKTSGSGRPIRPLWPIRGKLIRRLRKK